MQKSKMHQKIAIIVGYQATYYAAFGAFQSPSRDTQSEKLRRIGLPRPVCQLRLLKAMLNIK